MHSLRSQVDDQLQVTVDHRQLVLIKCVDEIVEVSFIVIRVGSNCPCHDISDDLQVRIYLSIIIIITDTIHHGQVDQLRYVEQPQVINELVVL